jgi:hypothetical protein
MEINKDSYKLFYIKKFQLKLWLNLSIINSELNDHKESLKLSKKASFLAINLLKEIFSLGY